jgi:alpha-beta hydrolase superfamily lysophospholipase
VIGSARVAPPMETEELSFPGSAGHRLAGTLHLPESRVRGSVLLAHCFTCSKDLHTMRRLAHGLADAGYAVLRFDFTGLGESSGTFGATTVSHDVRDLVAAATALIREGYGPCGLLGHSLGGAASLLAARRLKTVRSVVVLGAPASPAHVRHLVGAGPDVDSASVPVTIAGRTFEVGRGFFEDLERHDQEGAVASLGRPLLVLHALEDEVVGFGQAERNFEAARQPKALIPLLHADHLLTRRASAGHALQHVLAWFDATL